MAGTPRPTVDSSPQGDPVTNVSPWRAGHGLTDSWAAAPGGAAERQFGHQVHIACTRRSPDEHVVPDGAGMLTT